MDVGCAGFVVGGCHGFHCVDVGRAGVVVGCHGPQPVVVVALVVGYVLVEVTLDVVDLRVVIVVLPVLVVCEVGVADDEVAVVVTNAVDVSKNVLTA